MLRHILICSEIKQICKFLAELTRCGFAFGMEMSLKCIVKGILPLKFNDILPFKTAF